MARSKPPIRASCASTGPEAATTSSVRDSSGVPRSAARIRISSSLWSEESSSSGSRTIRNSTAITANSSTVSQSTPPSRCEASCQTSALMNRNVTNTSSSGSARATIGSSSRRLVIVWPTAQVTIGRARTAVTPYQSPASARTSVTVAGANGGLVEQQGQGDRDRGTDDEDQDEQGYQPARAQGGARGLALAGHEPGQAVSDEPDLGLLLEGGVVGHGAHSTRGCAQCPRNASSSHHEGSDRTTLRSTRSGRERSPVSQAATASRSAGRRTVAASNP